MCFASFLHSITLNGYLAARWKKCSWKGKIVNGSDITKSPQLNIISYIILASIFFANLKAWFIIALIKISHVKYGFFNNEIWSTL